MSKNEEVTIPVGRNCEVRSKITILGLVAGETYPAIEGHPPGTTFQVTLDDGTIVPVAAEAVVVVKYFSSASSQPVAQFISDEEKAVVAARTALADTKIHVSAPITTPPAPQPIPTTPVPDPQTNTAGFAGADPMAGLFEPAGGKLSDGSENQPSVPMPPQPDEEEKAVTPDLLPNQRKLSEFTDGRLPDSDIDHVINIYADDRFPENVRADIPEINPHFFWDPNALEAIHMAHQLNVKGFLHGSPGTGKSTAIEQYAAIIRQPFIKLNGKSGIDASSFLGFLVPSASGAEFMEGMLPMSMRNNYLMVIDEILKIPAEIMMNFQTVFEENGFLMLDEKPGMLNEKLVKPSSEFRLMVTDNAKGTGDDFEKYAATQVQDSSFIDRIGIMSHVPYLDKVTERKLLRTMFPEIRKQTIRRFVNIANNVRESFQSGDLPLTLSIRGLKVMCRLLSHGVSERTAYTMAYHSKLAEDIDIDASLAFVDTVKLKRSQYVIGEDEDAAVAPQSEARAAVNEPTTKAGDLPW